MCEFFSVSRAAYYVWKSKLEEADPDQERMEHIQAVYETSHKTYGYRRITIHLQQKMGPQGGFAANGQVGYSFPSPKTQTAQITGRDRYLSPLPECAQS